MLKQVMNNNKPKFIILFCILYLTHLCQCKVAHRRNGDVESKGDQLNSIEDDGTEGDQPINEADDIKEDQPNSIESDGAYEHLISGASTANGTKRQKHKLDDCWISLNEQNHFAKMSQLEQKYKDVRAACAQNMDSKRFNERMLEALAQRRGIAERALQKFEGNPNVIPAGLNLGSYCMMRMPDSILFFYRLKLRNNTRFTVNFIHNDVEQLTLTMRLSLNDLHLLGEYERALTSKEDPSQLYYSPNKGEVEFLLKDVRYKVEGRYRLLDDRLHIEHIISEIPPMQILMRYTADSAGKSVPLDPNSLQDYLNRMQTDLDHWLKDYFNDFLMLYGVEVGRNKEIQKYENERIILLNQFADQVMGVLNGRIREKGPSLMMPDFTLTAGNGMQIRLYDGSVRGLDTMYRRSVTTGKHVDEVRYINTDIGFSRLKTEYRYDTYIKTGMPPVSGLFVLNSEDVSAHMALQIVGYKPSVPDLLITFLGHGKPESLTVEGPASRIIANFKHLLEHHIISIMSSTLIHHIRSLSALTKCDPKLPVKDNEEGRERIVTQTEKIVTEDYGDYDITTPMKPSTDNNDDNNPTETPDNNDDNNLEPAEQPEPTEDDQQTEPSQNDDNDEPTEESQYTEDDSTTEPAYPEDDDSKKPEYAFVRKESVELEIPPKDGSGKGESYKIDHNETFSLTKLNNDNDGDREVLAAEGDADDNVKTPKKEYRGKVVKLLASDGDSN